MLTNVSDQCHTLSTGGIWNDESIIIRRSDIRRQSKMWVSLEQYDEQHPEVSILWETSVSVVQTLYSALPQPVFSLWWGHASHQNISGSILLKSPDYKACAAALITWHLVSVFIHLTVSQVMDYIITEPSNPCSAPPVCSVPSGEK